MPAEIDNESWAERFTGKAGAGSTCRQWKVMLSRVAYESLDIFLVARRCYAQWHDLKYAGVGAVNGAGQVVKKELAPKDSAQVFANADELGFVQCGISKNRGRGVRGQENTIDNAL
jgi:hypothetical protein